MDHINFRPSSPAAEAAADRHDSRKRRGDESPVAEQPSPKRSSASEAAVVPMEIETELEFAAPMPESADAPRREESDVPGWHTYAEMPQELAKLVTGYAGSVGSRNFNEALESLTLLRLELHDTPHGHEQLATAMTNLYDEGLRNSAVRLQDVPPHVRDAAPEWFESLCAELVRKGSHRLADVPPQFQTVAVHQAHLARQADLKREREEYDFYGFVP